MKLSFLESILAPARAAIAAQRALIVASIERLFVLRAKSPQADTPVLFEIPLPRPDAQCMSLHVSAVALSSPAPLTLSEARINWVWHWERAIMPLRKADPRLPSYGTPIAPRLLGELSGPVGRAGRRSPGIEVELVLRRTESTEALSLLQGMAAKAYRESLT